MKLLVLNGSPRADGNTARLLELVVQSAKESLPELEVYRYNLNELDFKGCQACMVCKRENVEKCVQQDDLSPVLDLMLQSDAWAIGTPIYMGHVSGQLKLCLDRMYGFMGPNRTNRLPSGKRAVVVVTQGVSDENQYKHVAEQLTNLLARRGFSSVITVIAGGRSSSGFSEFRPETIESAAAAGRSLVDKR